MAEVNIPDKAMDAADRVYGVGSDEEYERLRATLAAAAPLIVADYLEQLADTFAKNSKACLALGGTAFSEGRSDGLAVARDALNRRVAELRGGAS